MKHSDDEREDERPGAILTPQQRSYLRGNIDKSGDADRAFRYKIRQRLRAAIHDLSLIYRQMSTSELRTTFEDDHRPDEPGNDPIPGYAPRDKFGYIGHGYENELGYPRQGDLESGFPGGKSDLQATMENLVESNPDYSKANPSMQRSLCDAVASLCRAATAAQVRPELVLEDGFNTFLQDHEQVEWVGYVTKDTAGRKYSEAAEMIRSSENPDLKRHHVKALERFGGKEDVVERYR